MYKKLIAVLLTTLMVLSLAACGSNDDSEASEDFIYGGWGLAFLIDPDGTKMDHHEYGEKNGHSTYEIMATVNEDGTLEVSSNIDGGTNTMEGTWEKTGDEYTFTYGDETFSGYLEDSQVHIEYGSWELIFTKGLS